MKQRSGNYIYDFVITTNENIMVINDGCDEYIINVSSFLIQSFDGVMYNGGGPLNNMSASNLKLVNKAFTLCTFGDKSRIILKLNQYFWGRDPLQTEALLQPHQVRKFGVIIEDCTSFHLDPNDANDGQCITNGTTYYGINFDGWKYCFRVQKFTPEYLLKYTSVELTLPLAYEPQCRTSRRLPSSLVNSINDWCARIDCPTYTTTRVNLDNTTHIIQTLQVETREYIYIYIYVTVIKREFGHCVYDVLMTLATPVLYFL